MTEEERTEKVIEAISARLINLKTEKLVPMDGPELSSDHFQYIRALYKLGETTFMELAAKLQVSNLTAAVFINKLLSRKILVKTQAEDDKNTFSIKLSEKGERIAQVYEDALLNFAKELKKSMSEEEFKKLVDLM